MPGSIPATSQLDWLISTTAMIVLSWSRATRDLLKSFGWGIGALHRLATATMVPSPRRLPHSISLGPARTGDGFEPLLVAPPKHLIRETGGYHSEYDHIAGVSVMPRIPQPSHPANWRVDVSVSGSPARVGPG